MVPAMNKQYKASGDTQEKNPKTVFMGVMICLHAGYRRCICHTYTWLV